MAKNKFNTIVFVLILAIAVPLFTLPTGNSQSTRTTYSFLGAAPNPVGVGQETLLHVGITQQLTDVNMGWEGLSVSIVKPDGTTDKISNIRTDSTGGTGAVFVPTMIGNYTLQTHFPEQVTTSSKTAGATPIGTIMLASESEKMTLIVLEASDVPSHPGFPLPTEYWTRPISSQFREWSLIAGSWPAAPKDLYVEANSDAPETGHILWTKPVSIGGLAGGTTEGMGGPVGFETGAAYEQKFGAPIIIGGILFYNRFEERGEQQEVIAVDLRTGKELWMKSWNNSRLDLGQLFYFQSYNYMGTFAYLWEVTGSTWKAFDAFTGRWIYTMNNVPATISSYGGGLGSNTWFGPRGEIYAYTVNLNNRWMALWNSSRVVTNEGSWRPHGNTYNCTWTSARRGGYEWNVTIPSGLTGSANGAKHGEYVVGSDVNTTMITLWSLSMVPGQEGQLLYKKSWNAPADWFTGNQTISYSVSMNEEIGLAFSKETRQWWGFDLKTGNYMWGPTGAEQYLGIYGTSTAIAYGKLYQCYMSGIVYCYDISSGKLLWTYDVKDPLNEILWSDNWPARIVFAVDEKIYLVNTEHSPNQPLPRGGPMVCLNAITGELIWSMTGLHYYYRTNVIMGDNVITLMNSYDQRIYAIGKGPSEISVAASPKISLEGSSVLIEGTVMDISPGTGDAGIMMRFPKGVPVVSDQSQSAWMEYVHMQYPRPIDVTGVAVKISVIDANGNFREIGTTTSNDDGFFSLQWQPDITGIYTVYAAFEGSEAYYPSHAVTAFAVDPAAATPTPQATQPASLADQYILPGIIGIIVAIAIGFAVTLLVLKKKP